MQGLIIDNETGEIIGEIVKGDRIVRKASIDYLKDKGNVPDGYDRWVMKHFFKGNIDELKLLNKDLSATESGFLFKLIPYVNYKDCCLTYPNGTTITLNGLMDITGLSKRTVIDLTSKLVKKNVICRNKNSKSNQYFMNPWLFTRGNAINATLKRMFENYLVRTKGRKWKDM